MQRLGAFLLQDESPAVEPDMSEPGRVRVSGATCRWPVPSKKDEEKPDPKKKKRGDKRPKKAAETSKDSDADSVAVAAEEPQQPPFQLSGVDLDLAPGSLTMIIGRVGCGKSTFLSSLNAFVPIVEGDVKVSGRVAYVAQTAWILNSTVKDNILFGKPCDKAKYEMALRVSQLAADFEILPDKDATMIGERGVTLSGGQKQRVAIARAVYASADVISSTIPCPPWTTMLAQRCLIRCWARTACSERPPRPRHKRAAVPPQGGPRGGARQWRRGGGGDVR